MEFAESFEDMEYDEYINEVKEQIKKDQEQKIIDASNALQLNQILSNAKFGDLVIFDVDDVMIVPKDKFLRPKADSDNAPYFDDLFYPWGDFKKKNL